VTGRVLPFMCAEVRIISAGTGELKQPAYLYRYPNRIAFIDVVVLPRRPLHECSALRRRRPVERGRE
jgi:hypothetical protein